jgi:hypothetical protein
LKEEWGYLKNSKWHLNYTIFRNIFLKSFIKCKYRNISRVENDFKIVYSNYEDLFDGQKIYHDVIHVYCHALFFSYSNLHVQIVDRYEEISKIFSSKDKIIYNKEIEEQCKPMNILLLSYDSLSRVSWFKRLPRTTDLILNRLNFTLLYGQSILSDGTPACMIPLFTGKQESELPSVLKSDLNATFVDQAYIFLWNDLHKKGNAEKRELKPFRVAKGLEIMGL